MFIIRTEPVGTYNYLPGATNIIRRKGALYVSSGGAGEFLSPPISPFMATGFFGFEIVGSDDENYVVAVKKPGLSYLKLVAGKWVSADAPEYYTCEQLRSGLRSWIGPIQFLIRLITPTAWVSEIKVGYAVAGDSVSILLKTALKPLLEQATFSISHFAEANESGDQLPIPPGIEPSRVAGVKALLPEVAYLDAELAVNSIYPSELLPPRAIVQLNFEYRVAVELVTGVLALPTVPCILIQQLAGTNYRRPNAEDVIKMAEGMHRLWESTFLYDLPIQITVVGATAEEVATIVDQIVTLIEGHGYLEVKPFGLIIPLQVKRGVRTPNPPQADDNLFRQTFEIILLQLWQGESIRDVPTLTGFDQDFSPSSR